MRRYHARSVERRRNKGTLAAKHIYRHQQRYHAATPYRRVSRARRTTPFSARLSASSTAASTRHTPPPHVAIARRHVARQRPPFNGKVCVCVAWCARQVCGVVQWQVKAKRVGYRQEQVCAKGRWQAGMAGKACVCRVKGGEKMRCVRMCVCVVAGGAGVWGGGRKAGRQCV